MVHARLAAEAEDVLQRHEREARGRRQRKLDQAPDGSCGSSGVRARCSA
jgi:hypothetical protein